MNNQVVLSVLVLSFSGIGFLTINNWLSEPSKVISEPSPLGTLSPKTLPSIRLEPMNVQSNVGSNWAKKHQNIKNLNALSLHDIAKIYALNDFPQINGRLLLKHRTRVVVEELVLMLLIDEVLRSKSRLEQAVALSHGSQIATEFSSILTGFINYKEAVNAIDNQRNSGNFTPSNPNDDYLLRQRLQDEAFGKEKSSQLFRAERETTLFLAKKAYDNKELNKDMSPEQIQAIENELASIMKKY